MSFALCKPAMNVGPLPRSPIRRSIPHRTAAAREFHSLEMHPPNRPVADDTAPLLAELQIAVLYQLNLLGADTAEPIEVKRTDDGTLGCLVQSPTTR